MAGRARGYKLRFRADRGWTVRFRHEGKRFELATGVRRRGDSQAAEERGRELFASTVRGEQRGRAPASKDDVRLEEVTPKWLSSIAVRDVTRQEYEFIAAHWIARWTWLSAVTTEAIELYAQERLSRALGKTVASDMSALRGLLRWCKNTGYLSEVPDVPRVPTKGGVKSKRRTRSRAPELTPDEVWSVINRFPERATFGGFPIRARAIVAYLTTLRPATLDKLRVPDHYSKGSAVLRITADIDKENNEREVPLADRARKALDSVCPEAGLIFGKHQYHRYTYPARKVLPPQKARVFTWQHFRSAGITHYLEQTSNLPGVQFLAGHSKADTTAKYARRSFRAALDVIRGTKRGTAKQNRKKRSA
jgi:site-specific recombinase XerC